jgi:EAL domain-containing protein (putative c-di-GMP-specific phosphodiesterase class I)/ActR/RegA family two-component response regulator
MKMRPKAPVLVAIDDERDIAETVCAIATRVGFRSLHCTSARHLREALSGEDPDVIVLDLQMPGEDGISTLRHLADAGCAAKIILLTGLDARTMAAAEQYGVRRGLHVISTLQKPFDPDELIGRLEHAHAAIRPLTAADLAKAIESGELVVYYQPILRRFADNTWDISSVEALLRWNHPIRGLLTPDQFVALGETSGLTRAMTDFVLQRGIEQLKGWQALKIRIGLRVNIAATLISDIAFPDRLETMLVEQSIDADALALEITETAMLEQTPDAFDILTRLRIKNIGLAIDDFGIGYSSLTQLFRMPFNEMKIDRSLVSRIVDSREASIMVDALVSLAHKLNLTACAEGVEDEATLNALSLFGCDYAQGYHVSKPVPAAEIPRVIAHWDRRLRVSATRTAGRPSVA